MHEHHMPASIMVSSFQLSSIYRRGQCMMTEHTTNNNKKKMASKVVVVALVLVALVAGHAASGESAHAVPLRRAERSLGWMNDMRGRPSVTAATTAHRRAMIGKEGSRHVGGEEGKFIVPVPGFRIPPLPPNAA